MTADEAKAGMTESQSLRLDCALNLHGFAESVIAINRGEPKDDEDRIRRWNGVTLVRLPFADIHAIVMEAYFKVREFRKEIEK